MTTAAERARWQLLIFDWDGTLVDSQAAIVAGMQRSIKRLRLPPRSDARIAELIGLGAEDGLGRLYPDVDTGWLIRQLALRRGNSSRPVAAAPLIAGVLSALQHLRARGYCLAVATGKSRRGLDAALEVHGPLRDLFEWTRCADESSPKPAPTMVLDLLEVSGFRPAQALVIGDTEYDVAMARAATVDAVGVASGSHDMGRLRAAGALTVLASVAALPGWLAAQSASE